MTILEGPLTEIDDSLDPDFYDTRRRLVVIGNGMAGARAVEEILQRGGGEQFRITMFGDEPYGNYNRIMLSHVLSGEETDAAIFLNSLPWYVENASCCMPGCGPPASTGSPSSSTPGTPPTDRCPKPRTTC